MGILQKLFGKPTPREPYPVTVQLNVKIMPEDRDRLFQEPLAQALSARGLGISEDAGTLCSKEGEVLCCDVEVDLHEGTEAGFTFIKETVERLGAPKGSRLHVSANDIRPIGVTEGLGIYLNGSELPDETYASCDSNFVRDELERLVAGEGRLLGYWQGPTETAFYLYGNSFEEMQRRIASFVATYPLCHKCRIVRIA